MDILWDLGSAIERALTYVETHHWMLGFLAVAYIYYLHDKRLHYRFDVLEKRVEEVNKRLALM